MKKILTLKWLLVFFFLVQGSIYSQENQIKIYESKSGNGACVIVFPNSPEPLMVMTADGECSILKTMAHDDWHEMSSTTVVTASEIDTSVNTKAISHSVKSPRDPASGQATGKRQHRPFLLSDLSLDSFVGESTKTYSFSWNIKSNTGAKTAVSKGVTRSTSNGCCSNGVCSVTVSVDKKHTKTGHVTLLK